MELTLAEAMELMEKNGGNLDLSYTEITAIPDGLTVLLPSKITLLSNMANRGESDVNVLLPSKITLLSNEQLAVKTAYRFYYLLK